MSISQINANSSLPDSERRRHARQKLSDLAYLDIGADNGGIILNLSEEGMGIQSAVPLSGETMVNLRIQLPHSRARLETAAEIVWLGPESQQAGVRFLDMSSEARVQIQDWIRKQLSPIPAPQRFAQKIRDASGSPRKQESIPETRKTKWLGLMGELEEQKRLLESRLSTEASMETGHADPIAHEKLPSHVVLRNLLIYSGDQGAPVEDKRLKQPTKNRTPEQPTAVLPPLAKDNQLVKTDCGDSTAATTSGQPDHSEILDWPLRASRIVPMPIPKDAPKAPVTPTKLVDPPVSAAEENTTVGAIRATTIRTTPAPARSSRAGGWVVPAILLASICVLFFGVGTWVGRPGSQAKVEQPPAESALAVPVTESPSNLGGKEDLAKHPRVNAQDTLTRGAAAKFEPKPQQRRVTLTPSPPVEISIPQPTPTKANSTVLTPAKPSEITPAPVAATPTPDSAPPATRIVGARKLRPTDRFNPCHLSYRVEPDYPAEARRQRIEGAVRIHQVIGADGSVQSVKLMSGPPLLVPAAMDAAKYWRYLPALLNGQPVETEQDIEINFRLPN